MKSLSDLRNLDKAKLMFELFPAEVPALLAYHKKLANHIVDTADHTREHWDNNPLLTANQWIDMANEIKLLFDMPNFKCTSAAKYADIFFTGWMAVLGNHTVLIYAQKHSTPKFKEACVLFYDYKEGE